MSGQDKLCPTKAYWNDTSSEISGFESIFDVSKVVSFMVYDFTYVPTVGLSHFISFNI